MELQTEREILVQLSADVKHLTKTIQEFGDAMRDIELNKIGSMQREISELKTWKTQVVASWKVVVTITTLAGAVIGWAINYFLK
jgi:phage host-nuclease inhibitor protein Gam